MKLFASCTAVIALASSAFGQIVIDGTLDADYGSPKASQNNHTGFGNATDGVKSLANGSELNAGWVKVDEAGGYLYIFLSGNMESNFNKLEVLVDCVAGEGQNTILNSNPDVDFNGLNKLAGTIFDVDFAPDFYLTTTLGGTPTTQYANIAQLLTAGNGVGAYIGNGVFADANTPNLLDDTTYGCQLSIDNSNVGGVSGDSANPGSGCGVTTGIEIKIPLVLTGWSSGDIKVMAFVNGGGHDYASNQVLGSLPLGSGNLGGDGLGGYDGTVHVDFSLIEGNQYFSTADADVCAACFGDLDGDGLVGSGDVAILLLDYGPCPSCSSDLDGSGDTDFGDVALVLLSTGPCGG